MWDQRAETTFTRCEAKSYVGKTVKTSAGCVATITSIFCDGPDSYILIDSAGHMVHKASNNSVYITS